MELFTKKVSSLGIWNLFDIQFGDMLATSAIFPDTKINKQYKKKLALKLASIYLSANIRLGHTCLPLSLLTADQLFQGYYPELAKEMIQIIGKLSTDDWQDLLLSTSAVGNGMQISPLVLENKHLYLYRMWKDESTVAQFFNCSHPNSNIFQKEQIITILNQLFPQNDSTTSSIDWQKIATAIGITHPRAIILGGPGTGKTSVIHKIITALLLCNNNIKIKITAPTGKAATILTHSCQTILYDLQQLNNHQTHIQTLKATTIHSLLGFQLYRKKNIHNYSNVNNLDIDYIIIDEASMISLSILSNLISILPSKTRTIFLGDHDQLYSIEPGSVFQDICQFANINYSPKQRQKLIKLTGYILPILNNPKLKYDYNNITDGTCILKKNYRFDKKSGIGQLADAVKKGDHHRSLSILTTNTYTDLHYIRIEKQEHYINMIIDCAIKYAKYLKTLQQYKRSLINILQTFNHYRILCALRHGPFGVIKLNYYIEQILHHKGLITFNESRNYIGKPIIILCNEPSLGLLNGDIGILLPNHQHHLSAYFVSPQYEIKIIHKHQLPEYETCFVMTIHKAQGSEFQYVSIIFPNKHLPILTKELLYSAITRTQKQLFLYSKDDILIRSINYSTKRYSGLYNKMKKNI